ncbi:MAG: sugar ABC transporter ATP-binding protein [Desulfovibrio sp.]|jgi:ribose transport system ATP-binding protein|nr:sugar ABC transporter ATP-binding protein [Desulfovibrio sp.]
MTAPLLEFRHISKSFPGVKALEDVSVDLRAGEVHVIVGENGAGKSTLMKLLSGAYAADEGELLLEGTPLRKNSPKISEQIGIAMIYQELTLVPELSVADNIFLGHEIHKGPLLNRREMERRTEALLASIGIAVSPRTLLRNLSIANQQMIEITKALSKNAKIIVFDEPTSSLTSAEIAELFRIIAALREKGVGMFYISHRLEEIFEIGDRVTIMRDGKRISTTAIAQTSMDRIVEGIAGRRIENVYTRTPSERGETLFALRNLSGGVFKNVSLQVRSGEIVGVAGLVGSGRSEVARAAFGIDAYKSGDVLVRGKPLPRGNPQTASRAGIAFLPEDRKREGLALSLPIRENTVISALSRLNPRGIIRRRKERAAVQKYVDDLEISTPTVEKLTNFLSGGTQQKVVLAKWLLSQAHTFIFDEPTRGIDIGSKSNIYSLMDELVRQGAGILMISSELPEVLGMSDRIYVMAQGRIAGELSREEANHYAVIQLAFSRPEAAAEGGTPDER